MCSRTITVVLGIPLTICTIGVAAAAREAPRRSAPTQSQDGIARLQLPATWVPYTADVVTIGSGGQEQRSVRHRAADGSLASYYAFGAIEIQNVRQRLSFEFRTPAAPDGWISYPIRAEALNTPRTSFAVPEYRLRFAEETVDGLPVYELQGGQNDRTYVVPGLNMLVIRVLDPSGQLQLDYRNIRVGPPSESLFVPPPGAAVKPLAAAPFPKAPKPHRQQDAK
jgi:hypothetical protein